MRMRRTHTAPPAWLHIGRAAVVAVLLAVPGIAGAATCFAPDAGGTVVIPPPPPNNCPYVSPTDFHIIVNGLPAGTTIVVGVEHGRFINVNSTPGGSLGGEKETFGSKLNLTMTGTGALAGWTKAIQLDGACETHLAPRGPLHSTPQSFDTEMFAMQSSGLPPGDPDFDLLRITAGSSFGMPSPGHTTLTRMGPPGSNWNVDSFFDITYRIEFTGKTGGQLSGMSGSTTGTIRMGLGEPTPDPVPTDPPACTVVDNGSGTVSLPPPGCPYVSPQDLHMMINGLPPGTTIQVGVEHKEFFNSHNTPHPDGSEDEQFESKLVLKMAGTGSMQGWYRTMEIPAQCFSHTDPRQIGSNIQSFDTEMMAIQGGGQLPPGDPDFDLLRITAGTNFGMPSPGHTTLTRNPTSGRWNVDSFFDVFYEIQFTGTTSNPSSPLFNRGGSTTGTIRMATGGPTVLNVPPGGETHPQTQLLASHPNPFGTGTTVQYRLGLAADVRLTVYDAAGHVVRKLLNERVPAGPHAFYWDGRDDAGRRLRSGTYFVQMTVNGKTVGAKKTVALN